MYKSYTHIYTPLCNWESAAEVIDMGRLNGILNRYQNLGYPNSPGFQDLSLLRMHWHPGAGLTDV